LPVIRGDADGFLIQEEKAANATGTRAMGIEERGGDLRGLAEAIRAGTVKSLLVMGGDALSVPEGEGLLDVLGDLESLILITPNQTPISEHASVLIPGATFAEKDGSFTNGEGRVQWISRALNLPEGVETEGETLARIKAFLDNAKPEPFDAITTLGKVAESIPEYAHINRAELGADGLLSGIQEAPEPEPEPTEVTASGEA
jgi:predicted molibdopterin-dependent oxidoreductase YjgC